MRPRRLPPGRVAGLKAQIAGVLDGPPAERERVAAVAALRVRDHGFVPEANNWGGVRCGRCHRHDDGHCVVVGGTALQRFETPEAGMRRLVELCCVSEGERDALSGFRSELQACDTGGLFGPNEKAEKTFQELSAAWAGLEKDPGKAELEKGIARDSYAAWIRFRDKWRAGDEDVSNLAPAVAELNMVKENLKKPRSTIQASDVTEYKTGLQAAQAAEEGNYSKALDKAWSGVPKEWRAAGVGAGIGGALLAILLVLLRR